MGTAQILIVFSALMALIALVTIGIDWIGKPLKHRRFIPRIYRFEDEKLPVDAYGHAQLIDPAANEGAARPSVVHSPYAPPYAQPLPMVVAHVPGANATVQVPVAAPAVVPPVHQPAATGSKSAFSDSISSGDTSSHSASSDIEHRSTIAGTAAASNATATASLAASAWQAGQALDISVEGRKPSLAVKAERFWITTASSIADASTGSHFDDENLARMAAGKAPRRMNPRTNRAEAMQLTGLRQASGHAEVRMRWPDEAADPWASS